MISKARLAYVLSAGLLIASVLATAWQLVVSSTISVGKGCGYDGAVYCEMFYGSPGIEPYGRRILAPMLARLFSSDPLIGFRILDGLVVAGTLVVATALVLWSTRTPTVANRTDRIVAVLVAGLRAPGQPEPAPVRPELSGHHRLAGAVPPADRRVRAAAAGPVTLVRAPRCRRGRAGSPGADDTEKPRNCVQAQQPVRRRNSASESVMTRDD